MSTTTKIIIAAAVVAGAVITCFLFASPIGCEIRKKYTGKLLSCNGNCHGKPVQE